MNRNHHAHCTSRSMFTLITQCFATAFFVIMSAGTSFSVNEVMPGPLKDVKMGMSSSSLIDKIKPMGTYSSEVSPWDKRLKVTWRPGDNPYYENLMFLFTEKDRLYLIRFNLNKEARQDLRHLKKALFGQFGISAEDPGRLRIKDRDVLVYEGQERKSTFFEMTDIVSGDKSFELYSREISSQDRPMKEAGDKGESRK